MPSWSRGVRQPLSPSTAALRTGSGPRAVGVAGAAAPRRTRAGRCRARRRRRPGRGLRQRSARRGPARATSFPASVFRFVDNRFLGWPEIHWPRAPLNTSAHIETHIGRDLVQPRPQRGAALEAVVSPPRSDEGLLHGILGVERGREHPIAEPAQFELGTARTDLRAPAAWRLLCSWAHAKHEPGQPHTPAPMNSPATRRPSV